MQWNNDGRMSWKTVKHIAQVLSVGVLVLVVVLSVVSHPSNQVTEQQKEEQAVRVHNKVENCGSEVMLSMNGSRVVTPEEASAQTRESLDFQEKTTDSVNENRTSEDREGHDAIADVKQKEQTSGSRSHGRNKVVYAPVSEYGEAPANRVVQNAEPDQLVSEMFENYGEKPEVSDGVITLFQYPVELGYTIDSNYDGKLSKKNTILNFTVDTSEEVADKNSKEKAEKSTANDISTEDDDAEGKELQKESDTEEENTTEESAKREEFKREIWSRILATEPVDVKITAEEKEHAVKEEKSANKAKTTDEKESTQESAEALENQATSEEEATSEGPSESTEHSAMEEDSQQKNAEEATEDELMEDATTEDVTQEEEKITADDTFFIIKGKMRVDHSVFVGDIEIKALGKDGFDRVRIGDTGEFTESVIIAEDAIDQEVMLYFTDGARVTTGFLWTYSKDITKPHFSLEEESYQVLESHVSKIYCTKELSLPIDMSEEDKGTTGLHYIYGDKLVYVTDAKKDAKPTLQQEFFGRIMMCGEDAAGNVSETLSEYFLVEQNAPTVSFSQDEFCTLPYSLWVQIADKGHIVSGIRDVVCTVNGQEREIVDVEILEKVVLDEGLEVPSSMLFPITFEEEGQYVVQIVVTDNAGNVTTQERVLEVTKPELVAVYMPEKFTIHIDPQQLAGREQIFSDAIELKNVSEFDVEVTVDLVNLKVQDEISAEGVVKDCEMYLVAPDTGEKIPLSKGKNEGVYSYRLPAGEMGNVENLTFVGITTDGSGHMWKGSDISLEVKLSFKKWE